MPRLEKGEIAAGIQSKSDLVKKTIERRVDLFNDLMAMPDPSVEILTVYLTAETLACWKNEVEGIFPVSVKTLRKHVGALYTDGLSGLCNSAKKKTESINSKIISISSIALKQKTQRAVDSALEMTVLYLDLLERFKKIASSSEIAEIELSKHIRRYGKNPHIKEVS